MTKEHQQAWEAFRESGFLWYVNRLLHVLGMTIVYAYDDETQELLWVFPERTKFRGFSRESENRGFERITKYIADNADELLEEVQ